MEFKQKFLLERRWVMTFGLRQALEILQKPQLELAEWLHLEIEKNPILELEDFPNRKLKSQREVDFQIPSPISLYESLLQQIREYFPHTADRILAKELLKHLDEHGFLQISVETIANLFGRPVCEVVSILSILQTFEPMGIFARNLQEALLIQLKLQGKQNSLSFQLVQNHYEDLLHGRYATINKKLGDITTALQSLARLQLRPANAFKEIPTLLICPDFQITKIEGGWTMELNESELPRFRIKSEYLSLKLESSEEKETLRTFITSAKWISHSLKRRRLLLYAIGRFLIQRQAAYLDQKGALAAITVRELSEHLQVHESTISRALAGKYAATPRGIIPLRSLISASPRTITAKEVLQKLVHNEDRKKPFTDLQLARELKSKGFLLSRRTVAKYRSQLKIGSALQRRHISL